MPSPEQLAILNNQIAPAAVESERDTELPAELSAAQCIFESGWLSRCPGNNCFGIKKDDHGSGVQYVMTKEFLDGTWEQMPLAFETYASLAACFTDHARLITMGEPYQKAWAQYLLDHNLDELILAIGPIYATSPGYAETIIAAANSWYIGPACQAARLHLA